MNPEPLSREAGAGLWQALFHPEALHPPAPPGLDVAAARFAELTSPAFAAYLLEPAMVRLATSLIDAQAAAKSRLETRFGRAAQLQCVGLIGEAGIAAVYFKGFAHAYLLYPDPDLRLFGDLDIIVRPGDLGRVVSLLTARGFSFRATDAQPWGFQAEGSFLPLSSADNGCHLDLHVEPDSPPIGRVLTAEHVFAQAQPFKAGPHTVLAPSWEHMVVLGLSNVAKDKIGTYAVRKLIDLTRLVVPGRTLDWNTIVELLERGRLIGPSRAIFALLARLGAPLPPLPQVLAGTPLWPAAREFERLVAEHLALRTTEPGGWAILRREFLLSAGPAIALRRNLRRFKGLFHPNSGVPAGWQGAAPD